MHECKLDGHQGRGQALLGEILLCEKKRLKHKTMVAAAGGIHFQLDLLALFCCERGQLDRQVMNLKGQTLKLKMSLMA